MMEYGVGNTLCHTMEINDTHHSIAHTLEILPQSACRALRQGLAPPTLQPRNSIFDKRLKW